MLEKTGFPGKQTEEKREVIVNVGALTSAVLGTSSQKISHFMSPRFVCSVTDCKTTKKEKE